MTKYLIGLTEPQALAYQRGLFMLSRPNPSPYDVTRYFGGIVPHGSDGTFAAELDLDAVLPLDVTANAAEFAMDTQEEQEAWASLVGSISDDEWGAMAQKIQVGLPVTVSNFIPEAISGLLVDAAAATAAGYPINT